MSYWSNNWLFEPIFDKEFKEYQILGFEQASVSHFKSFRIFPYLDHLQRQIKLLNEYNAASEQIESGLKPNLIGINLSKAELKYSKTAATTKGLEDWIEVLSFAKRKLDDCLEVGLSQKSDAERSVEIIPIGLQSERVDDGLLFLRRRRTIRIYKFELRAVRRVPIGESYHDLRTTFLEEMCSASITDFTQLKWQYYRNAPMLKGINAFLVETHTELPLYECVLPLVKGRIVNGY